MKEYTRTYKEENFYAKVAFERSVNIHTHTHIIHIDYSHRFDLTKSENIFINTKQNVWKSHDKMFVSDMADLERCLRSVYRYDYSKEFKRFIVDNSNKLFVMNNFV